MSKFDKTIQKFLIPGSIVTYPELEYLLGKLGYMKKRTGKTSGSRVAFIHESTQHIIRIHKPHPGNELKKYIKNYIVKDLKNQNLI